MPDFGWVQSPVFSPTRCVTCGTTQWKDGFVDTLVHMGGYISYEPGAATAEGRVYFCANCMECGGREVGMVDRRQADDMRQRLADAAAENSELPRQLEHEKNNKYLSLEDARKLLRKGPAAA